MAWILVMFDLPVHTKVQRRTANRFRKELLGDGYIKVQFSVYARPAGSLAKVATHTRRLQKFLPSSGEVRAMLITDTQWKKVQVYFGRERGESEKRPEQLLFF